MRAKKSLIKLLCCAGVLWAMPILAAPIDEINGISGISSYYLAADTALRRMQLSQAIKFFDKLTQHNNIDSQTHNHIATIAARTYLMAGEYDKIFALKHYQDSYNIPHILSSLQAINKKQWSEADKLLNSDIIINENKVWQKWLLPFVKMWFWAGQGDTKQAFAHLEELRKNEILVEILPLQEIFLHLHFGQAQQALSKLQKLPRLPANLARIRQDLLNDSDSSQILESPSDALSYLFLHIAQILLSEHPLEALIYARLANYGVNNRFDISYIISEIHAGYGDYDTAISVWQDFPLTDSVSSILASIQVSQHLFDAGRYDESELLLLDLGKRGVELREEKREALAYYYLRRDLYNKVIDLYSQPANFLVFDSDKDWRGFYLRGIAYERLGNWSLAESDLLSAHRLSDGNANIMNYLGYSWVDRGENLQRGFELLQRALSLRLNDGEILDSFGWAHYRLGDYASAVTYLEQATQLSPQSSIILDHLGDIYWRVGRKLEAGYQWSKALDLNDLDMSDDLRKIILRKLDIGLR